MYKRQDQLKLKAIANLAAEGGVVGSIIAPALGVDVRAAGNGDAVGDIDVMTDNLNVLGDGHLQRQTAGEIEEIELIGLCTDICVVSNALLLKAAMPETDIKVDASCCAGVTKESHEAALCTMKSCQIQILGN